MGPLSPTERVQSGGGGCWMRRVCDPVVGMNRLDLKMSQFVGKIEVNVMRCVKLSQQDRMASFW